MIYLKEGRESKRKQYDLCRLVAPVSLLAKAPGQRNAAKPNRMDSKERKVTAAG